MSGRHTTFPLRGLPILIRDIQMLLVDEKIPNEEALSNSKAFNIDDFIWPHGISPPLHNVRKRRFRKRINKRTIESVEQEVERLLQDDAEADDVKYGEFTPDNDLLTL